MKISAQEEFLLARCLKKDTESLKTLVEIYGRPAYGFLWSLLGDDPTSLKSILAEVFAETLRAIDPFEQKEPYLMSVMRHLVRKLRKRMPLEPGVSPFSMVWDARLSLLLTVLVQLSWNQRILLLLRDQMDFAHAEIASILSTTEAKVKSQLIAARLHFRKRLEENLKQRESK